MLNSQGEVDNAASAELKNPLSSYPGLDRCSMEAGACICNSKQVESSFSPLSTLGKGKGNLDIFLLSALYRKNKHACLQSRFKRRFLPGHTGVQRVVSGSILASKNHPWTDASVILLEECKYPRICAKLPSGTP